MDETVYRFLTSAMAAAFAPAVWALLLLPAAIALWIGRKTLSDRWGRRLFGRYWKPWQEQAIGEHGAKGLTSGIGELGYWLGKIVGKLIRR